MIKVVTGSGVPLYDRLLEYDAHEQRFHEVARRARAGLSGLRQAADDHVAVRRLRP